MKLSLYAISAALFILTSCAAVQDKATTAKSSQTSVQILSPASGSTVSGPVKVVFGLKGMGVAPAGTDLDNTGHHHLIIDASLPDLSLPIPASDNYKHFGGGQTQVSIDLAQGTHTLQLLMGNFVHIHMQHQFIQSR